MREGHSELTFVRLEVCEIMINIDCIEGSRAIDELISGMQSAAAIAESDASRARKIAPERKRAVQFELHAHLSCEL